MGVCLSSLRAGLMWAPGYLETFTRVTRETVYEKFTSQSFSFRKWYQVLPWDGWIGGVTIWKSNEWLTTSKDQRAPPCKHHNNLFAQSRYEFPWKTIYKNLAHNNPNCKIRLHIIHRFSILHVCRSWEACGYDSYLRVFLHICGSPHI